jgi:small subunit ribosomal protein S14
MTHLVERDKQKRKCYLNLFSKRENLKLLIKDQKENISIRYKSQIKLNKLIKDSSKVRLSNRCIITGRTHSVLKCFRMSRIKIRELVSMGLINGTRKSSW